MKKTIQHEDTLREKIEEILCQPVDIEKHAPDGLSETAIQEAVDKDIREARDIIITAILVLVLQEKRKCLDGFLRFMVDSCREDGSISEGSSFAEDGIGPMLVVSNVELQYLVQEYVKAELSDEELEEDK